MFIMKEGNLIMKNISFFKAEKYQLEKYEEVKNNIYKVYDDFMNSEMYVTSLSFEQEPEYDEGANSSDISQYPLEDILDKFYVTVEDFYPDLNDGKNNICRLEFTGSQISDIENLLAIVGKHVYNKEFVKEGKKYIELIIE